MKRKLVTLLCVLALAVSLLPVVAAAADGECAPGECSYDSGTWISPTCTEPAKREYHCTKCGKLLEVENVTGSKPLGHTWVEIPAEPATCETAGHGAYSVCEKCPAVKDYEEIAPLGHDWSEWKETMQPTCIDAGRKEHTCQRADCGKTEEEPVPAKGHDWGEWETSKTGTCTEKGEEKRTCKICHVFETRETDYVHGKTYVTELEGAKKPTCTEKGEKVVLTWCEQCNQLVKEREIVEVPALGHDVKDWTVTVEPTCVKEGEKQGVCQRCGVTVTETVAATGVHELDYDNAYRLNEKKPTCTEEGGYNEMVPCKTCDGMQNNGWKVLEELPHTQGDWEAVDKKTHHALCTECGTECAVENHKFVSKVIREATEKQKGLRQYTCKGCDYSYTVEFAYDPTLDDVPKTGDSMGIALITGLSLCMAAILPLKKRMR